MKKVLAMILVVLISLIIVAACAEEAVTGPANAFEYVRNFEHRLPVYIRDYSEEVNEQKGIYFPWTYSDNDPDYTTIGTPFGTLTVNTNDFSIVQCEFDISFILDGEETYTDMDARGGILSICALEYGSPYDEIYEAAKGFTNETMFDESISIYEKITDSKNYDSVSNDEEGIYTVYVTSAQYDYYLEYSRFMSSTGELSEYYSILAIAPGFSGNADF